MVKKKGIVWNYFTKKIHGTQVTAYCKFCDQSYIQNATRMEKHIERCVKCPENIKNDFMKLVRNKHAKSLITMKLAESWSMQQNQSVQNPRNENLDNTDDWEYEELNNQALESNADDIDIVETKSWNQNPQPESVESEESTGNQDWERAKDRESEFVNEAEEQVPKVQRPLNQRIYHRKISHIPLFSYNKSTNSFLSNKIQREEYLERLALRKIAELELKRKTLEFEKLQWEHTVEKTRNEMRWAHECRMMQLKEEHQRKLIEQTREKRLVYQL